MRTIVGSSTKKTKEIKTERIVDLGAIKSGVPTNVSQYGAAGSDIKELETAKHFASVVEKSAKEAASSAGKAEDFYELTKDAALEVQDNTDDSFKYLEEIRATSIKIGGQEANIDEAEKQVILHTTAVENAAQIASDSANNARASEANSAASASSANNSAVSSKESEQVAGLSKNSAIAAATKGHQILAQTEAVYTKTIDDVSQAVQSYLKDKGGFDPSAGLPEPDSWVDIFGNRRKLSCLWVADVAGTIPTTGVGFNEGDILIYNAIVDRYGRFSGELVTGGGGGGPTEFFNDIKLSADKRLLGTDSRGSAVELIKLANDIVEAGDKTKPMHLLAKDTKSAFVCVANAASGFDNYQIYHTGNKPTAADVGAYSKVESESKFVDVTGDMMTGLLNTTNTIQIKSKEVYHPGNRPAASDVDAVSLTKSESITGRKKFTQNPIIENTDPALSIKEVATDTEVLFKVNAKTLTIGTPTSKLVDVNFNNNSVSLSTPKSKTAQGTTADSLTRKDYVDSGLANKLDKAGGSVTGDLIVTGKVTVEGTGSIFKDINTTGQVKENNIRVYSPANKPNAIDVGALPISGGNVGGAVHVRGNITTDGTISEQGQRVYSPNNKPTTEALGVIPSNTLSGTPVAAYFTSNSSNTTGIKIRLPYLTDSAKMVSFTVRVYQNYQTADIQFSGYLYPLPNNWYSPKAIMIAGSTKSIEVTMGRDADGRAYVWLQGGDYKGVGVFDVVGGYNTADWNKGWTIAESNERPDSALTQIIHPPYSPHNKPTAADIGAIGVDNVYTKTQADGRFWQRTETVNRSFSSDKVNSFSTSNVNSYKDTTDFRSYIVGSGNVGFPSAYGSGFYQGRMSGVQHQGWSLYNESDTNNLYHGRQNTDGTGFVWNKIYHQGFRPTAADVGVYTKAEVDAKDNTKLSLSGGVMTGAMTMFVNSRLDGHNHVNRYGGTNSSYTHYYDNLTSGMTEHNFRFARDNGGYVAFNMNGSGAFHSDVEGRFYSQGFKPTAVDVGAVAKTGDVMSGTLKSSAGEVIADSSNNRLLHNGGSVVVGNTTKPLRLDGGSGKVDIDSGRVTSNKDLYVNTNKVYHAGLFLYGADATSNHVVQRTSTGAAKATAFVSPGDFRVTLNPAGGQKTGGGTETGSIKVTLPLWKTNTMMKVHISVFNYLSDTSFDVIASGYDFEDGTWYNCSAVITGASGTTSHPVYFGHDGTKACIWIGSVGAKWAHPKVVVNKVETGYSGGNQDAWSSGWVVSFVTSLGTLSRTISNALIKPSSAADVADTEPTPNTIVRRNSAGNGAFKGRLLVANSNDSDVGPGTASVDFVSSAGTIYGTLGDIDNTNQLRLESPSSTVVINGASGTVIRHNGSNKITTNASGATIIGTATVSTLAVPSSGILMDGVNIAGVDANLVRLGDAGRTMNFNVRDGIANVVSSEGTYRVYHQGFKPTATETGTVPINGDQTLQNGFLNLIATNYALGNCLYKDIDFASGSNSVAPYNNTGGSGITHTWESNSLAPNASKKVIKITHNPAAGTSPGFGGFFTNMDSSANKIFVQVFVAKLDVGREWVTAENAMGTNSKTYWATSSKGTGKWERYIRVTMCGESGSFSSGGHTYVAGGSSSTFYSYLAEATVYDITNISIPYSKNNKPTATDVGALPLTGGTVTGGLAVNQRIRMNPISGSGSFGVLKHQVGSGGESWITAVDDSISTHNAIGVSQVDGPKCWINGAMHKIYHQGFKPTAADVGAEPVMRTYAHNVSLAPTNDWVNTGFTVNDKIRGSYMVQIYVNSNTLGFYTYLYSGVMSVAGCTSNATTAQEIQLHGNGHYSSRNVYLRTLETTGASGGKIHLQIKISGSASSTLVPLEFKFKQII